MEPGQNSDRRVKGTPPLCVLVLSAMLVLLAGVGTANAARGLATGFVDSLFESANPGERALWLDRSVASGGSLVRLPLPWRAVASSQPADATNPRSAAYHFDFVDAAVRDARTRGLTVMLTVQGAPDWAEDPGRPASVGPATWKPNPSSLGDFMRAVATRYEGGFDPDGLGGAP